MAERQFRVVAADRKGRHLARTGEAEELAKANADATSVENIHKALARIREVVTRLK